MLESMYSIARAIPETVYSILRLVVLKTDLAVYLNQIKDNRKL